MRNDLGQIFVKIYARLARDAGSKIAGFHRKNAAGRSTGDLFRTPPPVAGMSAQLFPGQALRRIVRT